MTYLTKWEKRRRLADELRFWRAFASCLTVVMFLAFLGERSVFGIVDGVCAIACLRIATHTREELARWQ